MGVAARRLERFWQDGYNIGLPGTLKIKSLGRIVASLKFLKLK